jgi:hypothetical protein
MRKVSRGGEEAASVEHRSHVWPAALVDRESILAAALVA